MPPLKWRGIIAGILFSLVAALGAYALLPPPPALIASLFGLAIGGFLAGKQGKAAPAYQGAVVGAGYIALEALGVIPTMSYTSDPLTDTIAVIVLDAAALASSTLGGALSRVVSSSDTDRGR